MNKDLIGNLDFEKINAKLFDFLDHSPVPFFAVKNMKTALQDLPENTEFLSLTK